MDKPERTPAQRLTELRRSNAAGIHSDRRTRRNRSRADKRREAIRDQHKES